MTERTKQTIVAFLTGLVIVEIPVFLDWLTATPQPDDKVLLAGLLGGLLTALKRYSETAAASVATLHAETYGRPIGPGEEPSS